MAYIPPSAISDIKNFLEAKFGEVGQQLVYTNNALQGMQRDLSNMNTRQRQTEATVNNHEHQIFIQGDALNKQGDQIGQNQETISQHDEEIQKLRDDLMDMKRRTYKK